MKLILGLIPILLASATVSCSKVRLLKGQSEESASLAGEVYSQLPAPKLEAGQVRVVIFVDQSYSMLRQKCPQELDGENTDGLGEVKGCQPQLGADPEGDRYKIIGRWLDELQEAAKANPQSSYKIAIVPFSGGIHKRPKKEEVEKFVFYSDLSQARNWLKELEREQATDLAALKQSVGAEPLHMGTTVPYPTLNFTKSLIADEMATLKSKELLDSARFQFVYLSDGVFKPTEGLLKKARRMVGCPSESECNTDPSLAGLQGCSLEGRNRCETYFLGNFRTYFGDQEDNQLTKIVDTLKDIQGLPSKLGGGVINLSLIQIRPSRLPADDAVSPNPNIFNEVYRNLKGINRVVINDGTVPFRILQSGDGFSYRLDQFYLVNLNAVVDANGTLTADSDGDGLRDADEKRLELDSLNPRSNGICFDGLLARSGCRTMGCEATLDPALTGLNYCERKTLALTPQEIDSDRDGILDLHEIARDLNPLSNESRLFTAGDRHTDHQHFFAGLLPSTPWRQAEDRERIVIEMDSGAYAPLNGSAATSATYSIRIKNVPLVQTLATKDFSPLLQMGTKKAAEVGQTIGPLPHGEGINQIVMVAKVVANESPQKVYWLLKREHVKWESTRTHYYLNVNFNEFQQLVGVR